MFTPSIQPHTKTAPGDKLFVTLGLTSSTAVYPYQLNKLNMKRLKTIFLIGLLCLSFPAAADSLIALNSLNYPVWIERSQQIIPLAPGDELNEGDTIKTGDSGRAWLSMADGSVIKLGQDTRFLISQANYQQAPSQDQPLLDAALDVIKGAFRFTTSFFNPKRKTSHQVNLKVGAITLGLRGTDVWGRSSEGEDFVALIEGTIEVSSDGDSPRVLTEPLSLYRKLRGQPVDPPTTVELNTVQQLGAETELSEALGIATTAGLYDLVVMSLQDPTLVSVVMDRFNQAGYALQQANVVIDDQPYTRLYLKGLVSQDSAKNLLNRINEKFGVSSGWIKLHDL